jgi:hydroxymethylbilane synthase
MRISTRSSKLALRQVDIFLNNLNAEGLVPEIKKQITSGDIKSQKGENLFDKAHFVEDIEKSLINNEADIAIHSLKDMAVVDNEHLEIYAMIGGVNRGDRLILKNDTETNKIENLHIGTSSLRRFNQCKHFMPSCKISEIRGNVDTRIEKLNSGEFDAIILANAGLERLGLSTNSISLDMQKFLPAVGQGIIAIQCRKDDYATKRVLDPLRDEAQISMINLERAFIKQIGGNCHSAVSVMASSNGQNLSISSQIFGKNDYIALTETGLLKDGQLLLDKMVKQAEQLGGIELLNEYN